MTDNSIGRLIDGVAARLPEQHALKIADKVTTYGALARASNRFANAMLAADVGRGDRVMFIGRNSEAFFISFFGTAKMGGVYVNVNWRLAPNEMAALIADAAPKVILVEPEFEDLLQASVGDNSAASIIKTSELDDLLASADENAPDVIIHNDDVVMQMYTSGTTGVPKGVRLTHAGLLFNRTAHTQLGDWAQWDETDRLLLCTPGFHISAVAWVVLGLATGATIVVIKDFVPAEVLSLMAHERVTQMMAVPAMMAMLLMVPEVEALDLPALKAWYYGASPISPSLLQTCMNTFDCDFVQLYGMTESSGLIACLSPDDHRKGGVLLTSCGRNFQGTEVHILAADGGRVPVGDVGEVVIKTPAVMKGYWNRKDETTAVVRDGWYHTGDAGYIDEEGYIYIVDRVKDMIISGAENIYPVEVEKVLMGHDGVLDVGVIGVPSPLWGEEVKAIVVKHPEVAVDAKALIAFCHTTLAGYKCPKTIDFVEALPRNASGKILKKDLRAPYWQGATRGVN